MLIQALLVLREPLVALTPQTPACFFAWPTSKSHAAPIAHEGPARLPRKIGISAICVDQGACGALTPLSRVLAML